MQAMVSKSPDEDDYKSMFSCSSEVICSADSLNLVDLCVAQLCSMLIVLSHTYFQ